MDELKRCPFCGGKAKIRIDQDAVRDSDGKLWAFMVACTACCGSSGLSYKPEIVIEHWNMRVKNA